MSKLASKNSAKPTIVTVKVGMPKTAFMELKEPVFVKAKTAKDGIYKSIAGSTVLANNKRYKTTDFTANFFEE